tara:strand:- start:103 stop:294 length:192 start_codon:yes stop_codon:yes gene_type:complete
LSKIKVGDLVYVPSDVAIFNKASVFRLPKPLNLLVTDCKDNMYEVLLEDERWFVRPEDTYPME